MLELLLAAQGRVVSAEELLARVWDEAADPFTGTVKVTISRLRAKLGDPSVIETSPRRATGSEENDAPPRLSARIAGLARRPRRTARLRFTARLRRPLSALRRRVGRHHLCPSFERATEYKQPQLPQIPRHPRDPRISSSQLAKGPGSALTLPQLAGPGAAGTGQLQLRRVCAVHAPARASLGSPTRLTTVQRQLRGPASAGRGDQPIATAVHPGRSRPRSVEAARRARRRATSCWSTRESHWPSWPLLALLAGWLAGTAGCC